MTAIDPRQLEVIAAFLETSRNHLDIEYVIRLRWPPASAKSREKPEGRRSAWQEKPARASRHPKNDAGLRASA